MYTQEYARQTMVINIYDDLLFFPLLSSVLTGRAFLQNLGTRRYIKTMSSHYK